MKRWALLTVGLYMLILLVLAAPVICMCFVDEFHLTPGSGPSLMDVLTGIYVTAFDAVLREDDSDRLARILISPWTWALVMGLAQAALLVVPVRVESRRPVTKRWLIWPALAALIMLLLLAGGMLAAVWIAWVIIFGFYTVRGGRANFMTRLARSLIAGSILELLVAVPAHVLARARHYCCAGFGTFWGIAAGISVMLFAFGPAVFVLFARRYGGLRRPAHQAPSQPIGGESAPNADADIPRP